MNGQFLGGKQITVQYAFKKDSKGERHGTQAERILAAQAKKNSLVAGGSAAFSYQGMSLIFLSQKGSDADIRCFRWSIITVPTTATNRLSRSTTTPTTWSSSLSTPSPATTFISTSSTSRLPGPYEWLSGLSTPATWIPCC